jgi:DNA polymerase III epsilon subunit-like protein
MKLPKKLLAIDLECTGTDARVYDVIQIGAVVVGEKWTIDAEFTSYICPLSDARDSEAMRVNGISEETLAAAPEYGLVLDRYEEFAKKVGMPAILAAWGAYFDIPFSQAYYRRVSRKWPFQWRCVDLKSIAMWELAKREMLQKTDGRPIVFPGLSRCAELVGFELTGRKHDGLADIKNAVRIIGKFLEREPRDEDFKD